jgi:hypothetical protein
MNINNFELIAKTQDNKILDELLIYQGINSVYKYENLIEASFSYENLKPLKTLLKKYDHSSIDLEELSKMVAWQVVAQNKVNLLEKVLLGQLSTLNLITQNIALQKNKMMLDSLIIHEDIVLTSNMLSRMNIQAYETMDLAWIQYCEEKTNFTKLHYLPGEETQILKWAFVSQSMEMLEYLKNNHHINIHTLDQPFKLNSQLYFILNLATYHPEFYDHSLNKHSQFIDYLHQEGASSFSIALGYLGENFNDLKETPHFQQELFNRLIDLFIENDSISLNKILDAIKGKVDNLSQLMDNYKIVKEAQNLDNMIEQKLINKKAKL